MRDFRRLAVWQRAHALTLAVYRCTRQFPEHEQRGLVRQMRRAAVSIGANIAEGCGRPSQADFKRFLTIALGSASELEYHVLLAYDLRMLGPLDHVKLNEEVVSCKRMLATLIARIATDRPASK